MIVAARSYRQRDHAPHRFSWNETWTGTKQKRIARFDGGTGKLPLCADCVAKV